MTPDRPLTGDGALDLLTTETVGAWLEERGLVDAGASVEATELEWGVSNVVLAVHAAGLDVVVKQALPRLRVAEEWLAKRERTLTEADALRLAAEIVPGSTPEVLAVDEEPAPSAIARAPRRLAELEESSCSPVKPTRRWPGGWATLLRAWQAATLRDDDVARRFGDIEAFDQLRVDPTTGRSCAAGRASPAPSAPMPRSCSPHASVSCTATSRRRTSSWALIPSG